MVCFLGLVVIGLLLAIEGEAPVGCVVILLVGVEGRRFDWPFDGLGGFTRKGLGVGERLKGPGFITIKLLGVGIQIWGAASW